VLLNKRVHRLEHFRDFVKVTCKDGTEHVGQIVVGNDGVNSVVRKEMWRISDLEEPGKLSQKEKQCQCTRSRFEIQTRLTISSPYGKLSRSVWCIERHQGS
jgi:2-polyprenyl-6-methoxyphenol hydroxylase-like FAD-dependent oxidoreductase